MSEKGLRKGSPAPGPVAQDAVRLYSMRFCPFAHRTRLVLHAKGIKHETVNINLKEKPEWLFEKNPLGVVPVLEIGPDKLVCESLITSEFLDEVYPGPRLLPTDPYLKAKQKMLMERLGKMIGQMHQIQRLRVKGEDTATQEQQFRGELTFLDQVLVSGGTGFLAGSGVSMVDYMIWPWFERLNSFSYLPFLEHTPALRTWMEAMGQDPVVRATAQDTEAYQGFHKMYFQGDTEACDYGL